MGLLLVQNVLLWKAEEKQNGRVVSPESAPTYMKYDLQSEKRPSEKRSLDIWGRLFKTNDVVS